MTEPNPDPPAGRPRRTGDWEQWLDLPPRTEQPAPEPPVAPQRRQAPVEDDDRSGGYDDNVAPPPAIINRSGIHPGVPLRHPTRQRGRQSNGNRVLAVLIVLGVGIAVVSILYTAINGLGGDDAPAAASSTARAPGVVSSAATSTPPQGQAAAIATQGCEQRRTPDVVSGTDPGGTANGPDAILAFEYAYYVERSGYRARAVVADNAIVSPADQIQRGINMTPVGTRYCVLVTRAKDGDDGLAHWEVKLTEQYPGEQPRTFTQLITTRTLASRTLITAIASG